MDIMDKEIDMTYEDCLEFCRKRMSVMGYFPDEIEAAAKEMFEEARDQIESAMFDTIN